MEDAVKRMHECRVDGRARYFRYRQRQLLTIHNAIQSNKSDFVAALAQDSSKSTFEAELEVSLVLRQLQVAFADADFERLTERVATLRQGGTLSSAFGSALIVGHWTAPLETTISPLAAAITAGNVALTLLPSSAKATTEALQRCLYPALDKSAYPILSASTESIASMLKTSGFSVYAATTTDSDVRRAVHDAASSHSSPCHLLPIRGDGQGQNIAIVSKTVPRAELPHIARLLARANFCALGGQSLGALSFVTVHEEIHDELVRHMVEAAKEFSSSSSDFSHPSPSQNASRLQDLARKHKIVYGQLDKNAIIEGVSISSDLVAKPLLAPIIPVVPFTSTEEALNIVEPRLGQVLSVFADQLEVDYFATELRPYLVTANDLPLDLLTGIYPTTEWGASNSSNRWPTSMFERPTRVASVPAASSVSKSAIFPPFASYQIEAMKRAISPTLGQSLKLKLKAHANIIRRVFFLQGVFMGLGLFLSTIVGVASFGGYSFYKWWSRV